MDEWMVLREGRREEKGKTYEHGDESAAIKLRHDSTPVQYVVGFSLLASWSGIQGRGWAYQHERFGTRISGVPDIPNFWRLGDAEEERRGEEVWACPSAVRFQVSEKI